MAERFHLGTGTLAFARALGMEVPTGGHTTLSLLPRAYYALFEGIEDEARIGEIYRGVMRHFGFHTLDAPLMIGLTSENLGAAVRRIARFKPLVGPLGLELAQGAGGLRIGFRWPEGPEVPPLLEAVEALFWVALAQKGPSEPQRPQTLALRNLPPNRRAFEEIAGLRVSRAAQPAIGFSAAAARAPFATRRDDLAEILERSLGVSAAQDNTRAVLRRTLMAALPAGRGTIGEVARDIGTSPRSLQRRLGELGTSFRQELTTVRATLDAQVASARGYSAAEAAFLLGFRDVNSLYRARRHWEGEDYVNQPAGGVNPLTNGGEHG